MYYESEGNFKNFVDGVCIQLQMLFDIYIYDRYRRNNIWDLFTLRCKQISNIISI